MTSQNFSGESENESEKQDNDIAFYITAYDWRACTHVTCVCR